ncbi:MAG TPA: ATP-binding protein, partial [Caulobacteraceae bacterium]|nr:ATP-binding protein [Caulobacteraceae bacterium]
MDRRNNPDAPGAGLQPPELAGRDKLIETATIDMQRALDGRPTKGMMLLGLRGVGKTVLLNRLLGIANDHGFQTAKIEAPEGGVLPDLLAPELRQILYALDLKAGAGHKLRQAVTVLRSFAAAFKVTVGELEFGIEPALGLADTGRLQQDLPDLLIAVAEAAAERKIAIGLFIDEVQYL